MIKISSFTENDTFYFVEVDAANNRMVCCSCEDHKKSAWTCKHMFLVSIKNNKRKRQDQMFFVIKIILYFGKINR